ncbi:ATP-binding protein [Deltaproteobacteria bacterium TL4]
MRKPCLVPILGYAEMVQMTFDSSHKEFGYLGNIVDSAVRAKDLVKKILIISHSSLGFYESVQLKKLAEEVLTVIRASVSTTIDIHQEFDFDLPLISADPSQIYQVILNLCTNAVQAIPERGDLWIRLNRVKQPPYSSDPEQPQAEDWVCLSVQDNGCGMDAAILERIYEPFFTTKEKGKQRGTGLGLSIVSSVIQQHKGHIEVESTPGTGTIFRVYFPVFATKKADVAEESEDFILSGNEHVLLVDDEPIVNNVGAAFLKTLGYRVSSFTDSEEALKAFESKPQDFQLVITDYMMPHLTGVQLIKKMKTLRPEIPTLLVTGYSDLETEANLKEWGCDGILAKPYELKQLSQVISLSLAKKKF